MMRREGRWFGRPIRTLAELHATGYDHAAIACAFNVPEWLLVPDPDGLYFLVAATNCWGELSSTGRSSLRADRPVPAACP